MKTIVVPTDLSPAANNAARYAMHIAKATKSHILLCNAMLVPAESPLSWQVAWPLEDYDSLKTAIDKQLDSLATRLKQLDQDNNIPETYHPPVAYSTEVGLVTDVVNNIVKQQKATMVIMGMSGAGAVSRFFLGSKSHDIIENSCFPVLLIPPTFIFKGIKKIAFATDLRIGDIEVIHTLAGLARCLNAEILITHISDKKYAASETKRMVDVFLNLVTNRVNYPKIYYRNVESSDVDHGLNRLMEHSTIDMLAMVHRPHDILDKLFNGSHTQKLAKHSHIPLLVFPNNICTVI